MSGQRILLSALRVLGNGKSPAEVTFGQGLNVISGASNTGKSYILQCLDFSLGSGSPPKQIDESIGYEIVQLELRNSVGQVCTVERSLKGGKSLLRMQAHADVPERETILGDKHGANDPNTISGFFLEACGLWGRKIRTKKDGAVRSLSFRDIAHLIIIDENRIISDGSPVKIGQYVTATAETSVFDMLLSGVDDRSIVGAEQKPNARINLKARVDALDQIIAETEQELARIDNEPESLEERKGKLDADIKRRSNAIDESADRINEIQLVRQEAWDLFRRSESQRSTNEELLARFKLLEQHYRNDLSRLHAIIEADYYFSQLRTERCPLCGAPPEAHDEQSACKSDVGQLENLRVACNKEAAKIRVLIQDLLGTTTQLDSDVQLFRREGIAQKALYQKADVAIRETLEPRAKQEQGQLELLLNNRSAVIDALNIYNRLQQLQTEKQRCQETLALKVEEPGAPTLIVSQAVERFSLQVEELLRAWAYPGLTRVTFSEQDMDLIISGRRRAAEGKGLRAISYAAFTIGLLRYCQRASLPHPGFVVLDSPLVTYKRKDVVEGEAIPDDVKSNFFHNLATLPQEAQVIILENEDPPVEVQAKINYTHFSRSPVIGRYGFFPLTIS